MECDVGKVEDKVLKFFEEGDDLVDLIAFRFLRMRHQHWSSSAKDLEREISAVVKQRGKA